MFNALTKSLITSGSSTIRYFLPEIVGFSTPPVPPSIPVLALVVLGSLAPIERILHMLA